MICALCGKCHKVATHRDGLCDHCARSLRTANDRLIGSILVRPAFLHDGAIRHFVHRLKYGGVRQVPPVVVDGLLQRVPDDCTGVIPIPRAMLRTVRYGVDPAVVLAEELARRSGLPVIHALATPVLARSQARRGRAQRKDPTFRVIRPMVPGAVVIDDVVTTGRTLAAAAAVLGPMATVAVTLTTSAWR